MALVFPIAILAAGIQPALAQATNPPVVTGVSIQLMEIQAAQQNDPRASVSIVDRLAPGSSVDRRIQIRNGSDTARTVRVYTTAARIVGGSFVGEATEQNDLARWTTTDQTAIDLGPNVTADLTVSIDIPSDAPEGEQYAAIWAEVQSAPDPGTNVVSTTRAGLRVYLAVGAGNGVAPDFTIDSLIANRSTDGNPTAQANVTNTGGRAIELAGSIALAAGPGGLSAGPINIDSTTSLAPGESGQITVTLDASLPAGPWDATLTLTGAAVTHDRTEQLTFPAVGTVIDTNASAGTGHGTGLFPWLLEFWLAGWPFIVLALIAIAALLIAVGLTLRARAAAAVLASPRRASRLASRRGH